MKTIVKHDTITKSKDKLKNSLSERHITIETITSKDQNDCLFNLCDCKLLSDILWPLTVLIVFFVIRKQLKNFIDNIGDRIKKGDKIKLGRDGIEISQELDSKEVNKKAEKAFEEFVGNEENQTNVKKTIPKEEYIPKYIAIERKIFEVLLKNLYPDYRILSNRRLQGYEYDLIIETKEHRKHDFIIEVKYFPNSFNKNSLKDIGIKLDLMAQVYKNTIERKVKPILFIILKTETKMESESNEAFTYVNKPFKDKNHIKVVVINENDIETLNRANIIDILDY
ncbi:hypothetical protein [Flavobacterium aquatile]|uniref:Uncharacterized protein n=1 Tax=Flavobacterium aquatile LMG 4008 = ATCC 11947 TaxID=1453498 RepID=A0A095SVH9_9FLAO|nr:hypothetical protein [Flavobacterium aquatile]KGD68572.1 hypothetical protein LG45_09880 [Flavobacterium aquatile LMG 4008 = ATCC 11947]OXA68499.1 hypothetical protein B0A61_01965 [Flavobacterium aquatile LMG 4008 = ATCC 11947]GEC79699.1 hypothetical protein FAQ01_25690 [Flavobacterium aquatile]